MEKQQLEKYINEYGRDIYLFCKRLTQNKNTADDLYQETFLKLWELDNVLPHYAIFDISKANFPWHWLVWITFHIMVIG